MSVKIGEKITSFEEVKELHRKQRGVYHLEHPNPNRKTISAHTLVVNKEETIRQIEKGNLFKIILTK